MAAEAQDYIFVTEPSDSMKCLICFEVAREPKQHEVCGKIFCSKCIDRNGDRPCPNCRTPNPKYFVDKRGYQEIQELQVKCSNFKTGCSWTGTLCMLGNHQQKCQYLPVSCPNECQDSSGHTRQMAKIELQRHLRECTRRPSKCPSCGLEGIYEIITTEHDKVCEKKTVTCPHCCNPMERRQLSMHLNVTCELAKVSCKFESIGCKTQLKRKEIKKHEASSENVHFKMALDTIVSLKKDFHDLKQQFLEYQDRGFLVFSIADFAEKKSSNAQIMSPPFFIFPEHFKVQTKVFLNGSSSQVKGAYISVFLSVVNDSSNTECFPWPFKGIFKIELLNQIVDYNHHSLQVHFKGDNDKSKGINDFIPHSDLSWNPAKNTQYLMKDTLYFRVSLHLNFKEPEPWLNCIQSSSGLNKLTLQDQRLKEGHCLPIIKMPSFSHNKRKNKEWHSQPFYSHPQGYKLCLKVFANGEQSGKDNYVSVCLEVLEGPYDSILKWPFCGCVTIELLNQLADSKHHEQILKFEETENVRHGTTGITQFLPHSCLEFDEAQTTQYLVNDCLYFRIQVTGISSYKPWLITTSSV